MSAKRFGEGREADTAREGGGRSQPSDAPRARIKDEAPAPSRTKTAFDQDLENDLKDSEFREAYEKAETELHTKRCPACSTVQIPRATRHLDGCKEA